MLSTDATASSGLPLRVDSVANILPTEDSTGTGEAAMRTPGTTMVSDAHGTAVT